MNLADLFEAVAASVPDREAMVAGERRLTFRDLDERSTRLAAWMAGEAGVRPGDHVGVYLHNGTEYLETMIAAFKLRAVPVNVNYRYVEEELAYLFDDADLVAVVQEERYASTVDGLRATAPLLRASLSRGDEYESALAAHDPRLPGWATSRSADDRYVLYTGGTTGPPKGVVWRHEDVFFAALGGGNPGGPGITSPADITARARRGRQRCLPASPFIHGAAHWFAWSMLLTGSTVVTDPEPSFDPERTWRLCVDERVSFLVIVGDAFARPLADSLRRAGPGGFGDLSSLTVVLSGGAILSPTVREELLELLPTAVVADGFGASETGGQGQAVGIGGLGATAHPRFKLSPDTAVLDDDLQPVEPGSGRVGRLARRGRIPLGYHKDPVKTAATFPVVRGERWAVPGDLAVVEDDGTVTVLGRGSVSINTGGEKVHPEEVESCLKSHPAIFDAVVIGVPDERWGERVTAVISVRAGQPEPTVAEIAEHCRSTLAGYKHPRALVVVDEVRRSPSGKADYRWAKDVATLAKGAAGAA